MLFSLSSYRTSISLALLPLFVAGSSLAQASAQKAGAASPARLAVAAHSDPPTAAAGSAQPVSAPENALVHPEFPGGDAALIQFLGQNLRYPQDAWDANAEGKVVVSFWIDEQGQPYGFGVLQSLYPSLDAEAVRAMKMMPHWSPGRREGKVVPMVVHVPVVFRKPTNNQAR